MITTNDTDEDAGLTTKRASYIDMIQKHDSVQLCMGSANTDGLINLSTEFIMRRTKEDGTPAPTIRKKWCKV